MYVGDAERCDIQKFDGNGTFITKWGPKGKGNSQFIKPWGVAVDSKGDVYVSDQQNPVVQKFDNNGKFITKWALSDPVMANLFICMM